MTYVILGLCVAVAGFIKVSRFSTINYSVVAKDIEMDAILAVAVGGNSYSANMLAINVKRTKFLAHLICGILAGIGGFVYFLHVGSGSPSHASGAEMNAIASSIIGGTLLTGGVGNIFGTFVGVLFFILVLFAALTSSIALTESSVSTIEDELGWSRQKATGCIGIIMVALGSLSALGYGPLAGVTVFGMQFLDFFDFLTNSVMMPIAAIATCLLVSRVVGVEKIAEEVTVDGKPFRRKKIFNFMIRYLCPVFAAIILVSSVANALGWISM